MDPFINTIDFNFCPTNRHIKTSIYQTIISLPVRDGPNRVEVFCKSIFCDPRSTCPLISKSIITQMAGRAVVQRRRRSTAGSSSGVLHSAATSAFARKAYAKCAKPRPCESGKGSKRQPVRPRQAQNLFAIFGQSHSARRSSIHGRQKTCLNTLLPNVRVAEALDV